MKKINRISILLVTFGMLCFTQAWKTDAALMEDTSEPSITVGLGQNAQDFIIEDKTLVKHPLRFNSGAKATWKSSKK